MYGHYVGNMRQQAAWKVVTLGKLHTFGAGTIDEKSILRKASVADGDSYSPLLDDARDADVIFTYGGEIQGNVVRSEGASARPIAPSPPTAIAPPVLTLAQARPRRDGTQGGVSNAGAVAPKAAANAPAPKGAAVREQVMIPQYIWPRYACAENGGEGLSAEIVAEKHGRVKVRFLNARTASGEEWALHELRSEAVIRLGADGKPLAEITSTNATLRSHAMTIEHTTVPSGLVLSADGFQVEESVVFGEYIFLDPIFHYDMRHMAHHAGVAPEMTKVMVMVKGNPTWWPLPKTWNEAKHMFNGERWKMAMQAFVDKTFAADGFKETGVK